MGVERSGLDKFNASLKKILQELPEDRRDFQQRVATLVEEEKDTPISALESKVISEAEKFVDKIRRKLEGD